MDVESPSHLSRSPTPSLPATTDDQNAPATRPVRSATPTPGQRQSAQTPLTPVQSDAPHQTAALRGDDEKQNTIEELDESDPGEQIEGFDWVDLEKRYHDEIQKQAEKESAMWKEYQSLLSFFEAWASVPADYEVDRTFKRLRTRMAHVQLSEEDLEKKRKHYIQVISAFQSALSLLED